VLGKKERTIPSSRVQDVSVSYGILGRIFRYGDIRVESAGSASTEIVFLNVNAPEKLKKAILQNVN
jgi:uncharacterized membrane protein YdbT with pleckstrin-like domain